MYSRVRGILIKEFLHIARDPRTLVVVLLMPVVQLCLFGYAINTVVDHMALVIDDEAHDAESRALIEALQNSGYFDVTEQAQSREAAITAINAGEARVGLVIPPDFGADLARGQQAQAQLLVDGSDPNVAQTATFAASMVVQARSADLVTTPIHRGIDLRPVVLYNPRMLSVMFMVPGLIGLILQFQTLLLTAFAIVREREQGTLEQLIVTPIRPWELMLGKILPYCVTAFASVTLALAIGRLIFGVRVAGSMPLLVVLSIVFLLGSLGVGLLISTVTQTQRQAQMVAQFILLPAMLLSGFIFPREGMPWIVQQIGLLIPLTYFLQILRGVVLKGIGVDLLWPEIVPLAVFSLAVFALSAVRFRKRLG
jgi:ABC-2 type transport system permease protein